jgi:hypothetical protein
VATGIKKGVLTEADRVLKLPVRLPFYGDFYLFEHLSYCSKWQRLCLSVGDFTIRLITDGIRFY